MVVMTKAKGNKSWLKPREERENAVKLVFANTVYHKPIP